MHFKSLGFFFNDFDIPPKTFFVTYPNAKRKIYYCYNDRPWLIVETDLLVDDGGPSPTFCIENAVFSLV